MGFMRFTRRNGLALTPHTEVLHPTASIEIPRLSPTPLAAVSMCRHCLRLSSVATSQAMSLARSFCGSLADPAETELRSTK